MDSGNTNSGLITVYAYIDVTRIIIGIHIKYLVLLLSNS